MAAGAGAPPGVGQADGCGVCWAALWTKQLTQKRKVYHDGYLVVDARAGTCRLLSDDGAAELARAAAPVALEGLEDDAEGLTCCEGYLINLDGRTPLPGATAQGASASSCPVSQGEERMSIPEDSASITGHRLPLVPSRRWQRPRPTLGAGSRQSSLHPAATASGQPLRVADGSHVTPLEAQPSGSRQALGHQPQPRSPQDHQRRPDRHPLRTDEEVLHILRHGLPPEQSPGAACPASHPGGKSQQQAGVVGGAQPESHLVHGQPRRPLQRVQPQPSNPGRERTAWQKEASASHLVEGGDKGGRASRQKACSVVMAHGGRAESQPSPVFSKCDGPQKSGTAAPLSHRGPPQLRPSAVLTASIEFPGKLSLNPTRHQTSPDGFDRWAQYVTTWSAIVKEEINLRGVELISRLRNAVATGETAGPSGAAAVARKMGGRLYPECELSVSLRRGGGAGGRAKAGATQKRRKNSGGDFGDEGDDDWGDGEACGRGQKQVFLTLTAGVQRASTYRKDDIWYLSPSHHFGLGRPVAAPSRCTRAPTVYVARALWHGPDKNGRMAVEVLNVSTVSLPKMQRLCGLQGPNTSTELAMLDALEDSAAACTPVSQETPPLLQALTQPPPPSLQGVEQEKAQSTSDAQDISRQFGLNEEQSQVLHTSVAPWFNCQGHAARAPPICLIHGPFGTGKSSLLVALIHFATSCLSARGTGGRGPPPQVLVAAHTNVAVDRVIRGLVDSGLTDVVRVGSLKRISDKSLLRYSLHSGDGKRGSDAAKELEEMLQAARGDEARHIRMELEALRAGGERRKAHLLKSAKVVGVTCCSASLPVLHGRKFEVLVLDESSQMVEPLSLLPILSSGCRYLIAAGDPCQLPPVVANPDKPTGAQSDRGLARPLFTRLRSLGYKAHLLRKQYRCHPDISAVPNQMFYQGALLDGCSEVQRASLVPRLPALCMVDVDQGDEQRSADSASLCNPPEAAAVARIVGLLTRTGVPAEHIGVICFFKAQVQLVSRALSRQTGSDSTPVQVATVDSFQGAEKNIVVLSTAVTRPGSAFSSDAQRLNVALTRAKHHLIIVGCVRALRGSGQALQQIITRCSARPGAMSRHAQPPDALLHARESVAAAI